MTMWQVSEPLPRSPSPGSMDDGPEFCRVGGGLIKTF